MAKSKTSLVLGMTIALGNSSATHGHAFGPGTCVAEAAAITQMQSRTRNAPGLGPYAVTVDMMSNTYTPGATHFITISSNDTSSFTGFMVYAETLMGARVGAFDKSNPNVGSPAVACPDNPNATASHTSMGPVSTNSLTIPWLAPATDVGAIMLRSVVLAGTRGNTGAQAFFFPAILTITAAAPPPIFADGFEEGPP